MTASVVYAVNDSHMAKLSAIACQGKMDLHRGQARFLEAICPEVWPDMRLRVGGPEDGGIFADPKVTVTALRLFVLLYSVQPSQGEIWCQNRTELWAESEDAAKADLMGRWKKGCFRFHPVEKGHQP